MKKALALILALVVIAAIIPAAAKAAYAGPAAPAQMNIVWPSAGPVGSIEELRDLDLEAYYYTLNEFQKEATMAVDNDGCGEFHDPDRIVKVGFQGWRPNTISVRSPSASRLMINRKPMKTVSDIIKRVGEPNTVTSTSVDDVFTWHVGDYVLRVSANQNEIMSYVISF